MKGVVHEINASRCMVAIKTSEGYSIVELVDSDAIEVGDHVRWREDTQLGSGQLENLSRRTSFEVYFQNHWVSEQQLRAQLQYQ